MKKLREYEALQKLGLCPQGAGKATSAHFNGLAESNISKWKAQEEEFRKALSHEHRVDRKQHKYSHAGKLATSFQSKGARRMTLHRGRAPPFAACELELHGLYRLRRRGDGAQNHGGQRVTGLWLRIQMKRLVRKHCGDHAAGCFKASVYWLHNFARRFGMSLRRKTNSKAEPVEVRLPKIRRWHARLRRRLKRDGKLTRNTLHPKWGRWLPGNRFATDQVPMNLRCGDGRTYDDTGANRIWLVGTPADDGKRFGTLHIIAKAKIEPTKPRRGQPRLGMILRGTGVRIKQAERDGWHKDVDVRFQKKAWADDALCEAFAAKELFEATREAREAGERCVCFFDNLSGQTTEEHLRLCRRAHCDRHLLPTGTTGELMFIDGGIGVRLKNLIGEEQDAWMEVTGNLERWSSSPKDGGLQAWEKRVLVTQWAGNAWAKLCDSYDFEASARSLGMLMTADGSEDDQIKVQGLTEAYTFTDADGGSEGAESEVEEDKEEHADVLDKEGNEGNEGNEGEEAEEAEEAEDGMEETDEEDDTADNLWACGDAPAVPPTGYTYAPCPPLETEEQQRALVGRYVLVAHNSEPVGWHMGKVRFFGVGAKWKKVCATANFLVTYSKQLTDNLLSGEEGRELSTRNYGPDEWWLLLAPASGVPTEPPAPATPAAPSTPAAAPTPAADPTPAAPIEALPALTTTVVNLGDAGVVPPGYRVAGTGNIIPESMHSSSQSARKVYALRTARSWRSRVRKVRFLLRPSHPPPLPPSRPLTYP